MPTYQYIAESEKIKVARYNIGEVAMEFMESTTPDGEIAKFINNRGEGVFLISYKVDDLSKAIQELKDKNIELIDSDRESSSETDMPLCTIPISLTGCLQSFWKEISI